MLQISQENINWDNFPTESYLQNNYKQLHEEDIKIMQLETDFYKHIEPIESSIEVGTGPNLYPILTMFPFTKKITATDISRNNLNFLNRQKTKPSPIWQEYWQTLAKNDSAYRSDLYLRRLKTISIKEYNLLTPTTQKFTLASAHFCIETISSQINVFAAACKRFTELVHPDGYLVAAFMENSTHYFVDGIKYPTVPVTQTLLLQVFNSLTKSLNIMRIPASKKPIRGGYSGILLLTAQRK